MGEGDPGGTLNVSDASRVGMVCVLPDGTVFMGSSLKYRLSHVHHLLSQLYMAA